MTLTKAFRKTLKKLLQTVGLTTVAIITSLAVATPASAYDDYMSTDDGDPGGRVYWTANGDIVKVCDIEADGYAVRVDIYYNTQPGLNWTDRVEVGGNGRCNEHRASDGPSHDLIEGALIHFKLCLYNSSYPSGRFCDERDWWNDNS